VSWKSGEHEILWKFGLSGGTWWIPEITYKGSRFHPHSAVNAYDGDSYGCVDLRLSNAKIDIIIRDIQMQPRFDTAEPALTIFTDRWNDCTGFFSAAIWGGLFVVIILLSILTCGITAMLDIRTMDRFDDPKGKTITINAQE
jgi:V-type H+-transporting ATPase S1 subunit